MQSDFTNLLNTAHIAVHKAINYGIMLNNNQWRNVCDSSWFIILQLCWALFVVWCAARASFHSSALFPYLRICRYSDLSFGRSQWPHGLTYELSSFAWTLGSWVQIPLDTWMSVCVYSVCVVLCAGSGLVTGWSPIKGVLLTVKKIKKLKNLVRSNKRL
jgi:hypothetical protein